MKKIWASILMLLYLSASSGATIQLHYCMDRFTGWGIALHPSTDKCPNCSRMPRCAMSAKSMQARMKMQRGCCKDEQKLLPLAKDQKAVESAFQFLHITAAPVPVYPDASKAMRLSAVTGIPSVHAPPPDTGIPVFLRNCTFRI